MNSIYRDSSYVLAEKVAGHFVENGDVYIKAIDEETRLLRLWLHYISSYEKTGSGDVLIDGVSAAIREVAACLAAGFARVALGSIRVQIDLILSWLYFKDHPVEWARLEMHGDGFMQKSEIMKYLNDKFSATFGARFAVLKQTRRRTVEDPFSLLSAHLHKQASNSIVSIDSCAEVVCDKSTCDEVVVLQSSAGEFINDVLLVCYSHQWAALPAEIITAARLRLSKPQECVLFS
ncbi:hypothetical protein [Lysobacter capsici]|uniref:hypothetical protein n=1 Tax=Lysobacter capsici TaxID=435897 RepID=UPI00287B8438|nr:hypothetical protein [Lysobacter capsici]WND78527.1 hypothetical protein RJ610_14540 [Lysobacter capsici]WND83722.1 hypothetical protein RJ609_14550 [Lysobacter capsici]